MNVRELEAFGDVLSTSDLAAWLGKSLRRTNTLIQEGAFTFAEVKPAIGPRRFSRARLRAWADGELRGLTLAKRKAPAA